MHCFITEQSLYQNIVLTVGIFLAGKTSEFFPQNPCKVMCFVWFTKQTAIISLNTLAS
jgi:hypothetical protein